MSTRTHLSNEQLTALSDLIGERVALNFPPDRGIDLERRLRTAARDLDLPSAKVCGERLLAGDLRQDQLATLVDALTIGETYFFRDPTLLKQLEERVLLPLLAAQRAGERRLRIWSAGCSTGEEPYTLAMMLTQLIPDFERWDITILATDINTRSLAKAEQATYSSWSFRSAPSWLKGRYFTRQSDGRYQLAERVRRMVTFKHLNLAAPCYPSPLNGTTDFDLILCRNVLMYFTAAGIAQAVQRFHRAVTDGGWLIVSPSEVSSAFYEPFVSVMFPNAIFYRRQDVVSVGASPSARVSEPAVRQPLAVAIPDAAAVLEHAENLASEGLHDEAIESLCRLLAEADVRDHGVRGRAAALLARLNANAGNLDQAGHWCREAIELDRANPHLHFLLATVALESDDLEAAEDSLRRAVRLDRDFVVAHFTLGNVTRRQRKFQQAEQCFADALALLRRYRQDEVLPQTDGLTAGRLSEIATAMSQR